MGEGFRPAEDNVIEELCQRKLVITEPVTSLSREALFMASVQYVGDARDWRNVIGSK